MSLRVAASRRRPSPRAEELLERILWSALSSQNNGHLPTLAQTTIREEITTPAVVLAKRTLQPDLAQSTDASPKPPPGSAGLLYQPPPHPVESTWPHCVKSPHHAK
ncbi:hypothetical protein BC629DRAFT_1441233 [Irpex lacteus]|nr:hypothetical protein BC629DRAFT_1441233 [Irpex lacteus]